MLFWHGRDASLCGRWDLQLPAQSPALLEYGTRAKNATDDDDDDDVDDDDGDDDDDEDVDVDADNVQRPSLYT